MKLKTCHRKLVLMWKYLVIIGILLIKKLGVGSQMIPVGIKFLGPKAHFIKNNLVLYINPFDHPLIWEGHGSVIDELKTDLNGAKSDQIYG